MPKSAFTAPPISEGGSENLLTKPLFTLHMPSLLCIFLSAFEEKSLILLSLSLLRSSVFHFKPVTFTGRYLPARTGPTPLNPFPLDWTMSVSISHLQLKARFFGSSHD